MEVASDLLSGRGESNRTFWYVPSFGWPGWGLGPPEGPREGSPASERSTEEERGEENPTGPILRFACAQETERLPLLHPSARRSGTLGRRPSMTSAVGIGWGLSHKPDSHV